MDSIFAYSKTDSIIHRLPAWLKLLFLIAVTITLYLTPIIVCIILIPAFLILALISKIRLGQFLRDLRPIVIYASMILLIDVLSWLIFSENDDIITKTSLYLILRLFCAVEAASIFFRTTSIYEMMESFTFGKAGLTVSAILSLFLSFLPQIFATWTQLDAAYRARGGRKGPAKAVRILPQLISLSLSKARTTYLALVNRS